MKEKTAGILLIIDLIITMTIGFFIYILSLHGIISLQEFAVVAYACIGFSILSFVLFNKKAGQIKNFRHEQKRRRKEQTA
jgi:hypothetical protein